MNRIKELRIEKGLTQEELGNMIGVKKAAVQKYESGAVKNLKRTTILKLSNIFGVSPIDIMGIENSDTPTNNPVNATIAAGFTSVPIIGKIPAGSPCLAIENIEGYEDIPSSWYDAYENGDIDSAHLSERIQSLREQQAHIETQILEMQQKAANDSSKAITALAVKQAIMNLPIYWDKLTPSEKRAAIAGIIDHVKIYQDGRAEVEI